MDEQELIEKQKQWIARLVSLNKDRPLYGQYTEGRIDDFKKQWVLLNRNDVILTRQILNSEIVFDFDYDTWLKVRNNARKLVKYLDEMNIPYIIAHSGGKGIHVHVFIDASTFNIHEEGKLLDQALEHDIDIARVVRKTIFDSIVKDAKLKVSSPEDRNGLDTTKVYFSMKLGRGSLIREFGCVRRTGKVKTMIDNVPDEIPEVYEENTRFPNEIKLANVTRWSRKVEEALRDAIHTEFLREQEPDVEVKCKGTELPCYRGLLNGVDKGVRNIAVFSLARLGSLVGNSESETLKDVEEFCKNTNYRYSEAMQSVKSAYRYKDRKKLCGTICLNFGSELCNKRECPIERSKHQEKLE